MAVERFPRTAYVRQLGALYDDLWMWEARYKESARRVPDMERALVLERRGAALEDVRYALLKVTDLLRELPRLS